MFVVLVGKNELSPSNWHILSAMYVRKRILLDIKIIIQITLYFGGRTCASLTQRFSSTDFQFPVKLVHNFMAVSII